VVLVHGLGGSSRWWARNVKALARRHELHLVDLAGCGLSSGRFALSCAAEQLATWMHATGLSQASIIGHSMGGYVAVCLAAKHPTLVNRLVLVDAALSVEEPAQRQPGALRLPLPLSVIPLALNDTVRIGFPAMFGAMRELTTTDMGPTLAQVLADTLLVWGENDGAVPLWMARAVARRLPSAILAVISDAGHVPMWEQPDAFNHTVLSFLADVPITPHIVEWDAERAPRIAA
jgi:pimeloyl-ACP methyl ester carboxylesterase